MYVYIHNKYQPEIQLTRFNVGTIAVILLGKVQSEIKVFCDSVFIFRNKYLKVCDVIFSLRTMRHIFFFLFFLSAKMKRVFCRLLIALLQCRADVRCRFWLQLPLCKLINQHKYRFEIYSVDKEGSLQTSLSVMEYQNSIEFEKSKNVANSLVVSFKTWR